MVKNETLRFKMNFTYISQILDPESTRMDYSGKYDHHNNAFLYSKDQAQREMAPGTRVFLLVHGSKRE